MLTIILDQNTAFWQDHIIQHIAIVMATPTITKTVYAGLSGLATQPVWGGYTILVELFQYHDIPTSIY